ncbi:MAG: efflux RND transporter permease subunit, partial [Aeromicrobium sp.]|uniref:efflux RND transporter permease subunit n=1 Tax=Aeromicrobium sp. TaxID=1871063 RepID=UPI003C44EFF2
VRNTLTTLEHLATANSGSTDTDRRDAVLDAARERLWPVLTTSVAVAAVMLPFAVAGSRAGLEILHPLAIVVIGGLVTTVAHALLVVPALSLAVAPPGRDDEESSLHPDHTASESSS